MVSATLDQTTEHTGRGDANHGVTEDTERN